MEADSSKESDTSSEIGQLLLYLVASHLKKFTITRQEAPLPILGLYMKDMKVIVNVYTLNV